MSTHAPHACDLSATCFGFKRAFRIPFRLNRSKPTFGQSSFETCQLLARACRFASWARALCQSLLPDFVLRSLILFQIISQVCFTHARAFRPAGLPIARARMSLVRTAQSWIRTFPQIFAYILNAHSALACSRASMSWLINPRARTLRARPSVRALTGSLYMSFSVTKLGRFPCSVRF